MEKHRVNRYSLGLEEDQRVDPKEMAVCFHVVIFHRMQAHRRLKINMFGKTHYLLNGIKEKEILKSFPFRFERGKQMRYWHYV